MEVAQRLSLAVVCFAVLITSCAAMVDVALVEFFLWGNRTTTSLLISGPILDKGEDDLRTKYSSILNVTKEAIFDRNIITCDMMDQKATFWATRYYYREAVGNPVMLMLGPECPTAAASVGHLARAWNKPMLITTPGDISVANKKRYATLTRLSPYIQEDLNQFFYKVLKQFSYTTVGILCDDANDTMPIYGPMCTALFNTLRLAYNVSASRFYVNASDSNNVKHYLDEIKAIARVVIIIAHGSRIRPIMVAAFDQQMTGGEYVYFAFELYPSVTFFGNMSWSTNNADGRDDDARTAYRSLFVISLRNEDSPEYRNFTEEVKRLSKEKYGYTYAAGEEVNPFAMSYYYALAIYGKVLNETITSNGNVSDGRALSRQMWNRTFTVLGKDIVINENGDRDSDWALNQMDPGDGVFRPVMQYFASTKVLITSRHITWYNRDDAPFNEPRCGYRGVKQECENEQRTRELLAGLIQYSSRIAALLFRYFVPLESH